MIFTLAGSNSENSINQEVAKELAASLCCFYYDTRRIEIPVYNRDKNIKSEISNLYNLIREYEYIVTVIPEYNGNYSSFFKNILDELSIYNRRFFENKKVFIVSASPGEKAGASVRKIAHQAYEVFGAKVVGIYGIGKYEDLASKKAEITKIAKDIKNNII